MVLENAPVTGLLLGISVLSTATTPRHYAISQRPPGLRGWWITIRSLPLNTLPFGSIGTSLTDVVCVLMLLLQMRILERRWGSSSFLAFVLTTSLAGSVMLNILVTEATPPLTLDQLRIFSAGGSIVPLVALAVRCLSEVPSLHHWRVPIASVLLTENLMIILPFLRLVLFPGTEFFPRTQRQRAIQVDVGLWVRVLLTLCGVTLGIASTRARLLVRWLDFFSRYVCRPFMNFARPVLSVIFGSTKGVLFGVPQQRAGGHTATGGRYTVDNIAGFRDGGFHQPHRAYSPEEAFFSGQLRRRRGTFPEQNNDTASGGVAITDEHIARIVELGLGFDAETIRNALIAANGHVDVAVENLVSRI